MTDLKMNLLKCKICGKEGKQLFQHLKHVHNITTLKYREIYGKDELVQLGFTPNNTVPNKSNSDYVKKGYSIHKLNNNLVVPYTKDETRNILLLNDYFKRFIGRTKQRTLNKENNKLYVSIFKNTTELDTILLPYKGFTMRLKFIVEFNYDISKITCKCGKMTFASMCRNCVLRMKRIDWYKLKYPITWEQEYQNHVNTSTDLVGKSFSKVSQRLFDSILFKLKDTLTEKVYYGSNNGEWKVFLTENDRELSKQSLYCLDFKYKNKNIEFDSNQGRFIKSYDYMNNRDLILKSKGFDILRVEEKDYTKNPDEVISKCIKFILQ